MTMQILVLVSNVICCTVINIYCIDYSMTKSSTISINKRLECSNKEESIIYTNISVICTRDINYYATYDIRHKNKNLHCHLASETVKLFIRFIAKLQYFLLVKLGMQCRLSMVDQGFMVGDSWHRANHTNQIEKIIHKKIAGTAKTRAKN